MANQLLQLLMILSFEVVNADNQSLTTLDDGIGDGIYVLGLESTMTDFASLKADPNEKDLPDQFTICQSLHSQYAVTAQAFLQLYQENGEPWVGYYMKQEANLEEFTEVIVLIFDGKSTLFWNTGVPRKPHSWYHACFGLDTVKGHLTIVIEGTVLINEVIPYFVASSNVKPKTLKDRISLFKTKWSSFWILFRSKISNMQIYKGKLAVTEMQRITQDCSGSANEVKIYSHA